MFVIYGVRSYGAVDNEDGSQHATRFVHVYYLPLIPVGGVRIHPTGDEQAASMDFKSVLIAYARFWGFVVAAGLCFTAYSQLERNLVSGLAWMGAGTAVLLASLGAWFWAGVRRKNSPVVLALGFAIPLAVVGLMSVSAIKENLSRKVSMFASDSSGRPSEALLAFAKEQVEREAAEKLEKQKARCEAGEGMICNEVGYALAKKDSVASLAAYQKGCDAKYGMACFNLALNVGKTDQARSVPLYEQSCELGYGDGCNNLATTFEKSDRKKAVELFDKACKVGSSLGCKNLARLQAPVPAKKKRG
jgi:hypothetical protein